MKRPWCLCALLATFLGTVLTGGAQGVFLGRADLPATTRDEAFVSGQPVVLRFLTEDPDKGATPRVELFQVAGKMVRPIQVEIIVEEDRNPRVRRIRFEAPTVTRVSSYVLRVQGAGPVRLTVFPVDRDREDRPELARLLKAAGVRVQVCGEGPELRRRLESLGISFEDLGAKAPADLAADALLIGVLEPDDLIGLTKARARGRVIAFIDEASLHEQVYQRDSGELRAIKTNTSLLDRLPDDPRAREMLAHMIFEASAPLQP